MNRTIVLKRFPRRRFLGALAGTAAAWQLAPIGAARTYRANETFQLAIIGVWGYASATAFVPGVHLYENMHIVAWADVDRRKVAKALELWQDRAAKWPHSENLQERQWAGLYQHLAKSPPPLFADFRDMLAQMAHQIDAVVVATPDHTHAVASAAALRAGKPVLTEKPLTIRVQEARVLRQLAEEKKVPTSVGTQGMQHRQFRRGVELVREGLLGPVRQVHVYFARGGANQKQPPPGHLPVPPELNWDLWLGPVAWREYHPMWMIRTFWRDTSAGQLGNFGPHTANLAFMALNIAQLWQADANAPPPLIRVQAECPDANLLSFPLWERIRWNVPARGNMPPVEITWHHGPHYAPETYPLLEKLLRDHGATDKDIAYWLGAPSRVKAGLILLGEKGLLVSDSHNTMIALFPKERFEGVNLNDPQSLPLSKGHYMDWVLACRGGPAPLGRFEYGAILNEFLMLGDIATRLPGQNLEYDPRTGRFQTPSEANQYLMYDYRKGWQL